MTEVHLSSEEIAAVIDGTLDDEERGTALEHLADCASCREVLADAARFRENERSSADADEVPLISGRSASESPWFRKGRSTRIQVAVAAATAAVLAGTLLLQWRAAHAETLDALAEAAARLDNRPVEARVRGLAYRPFVAPRGQDAKDDPRRMRLIGAAGQALEATRKFRDAESQHVAGVAALLAGNPLAAAKHLRQSAELAPQNPAYWSDLSAALLESGRNENSPTLGRALAAADHALHLAPDLPEARFNQALILEALHLDAAASAAFERYVVEIDGTDPWAEEAREHIRRLHHMTRAESWQAIAPRLLSHDPAAMPSAEELRRITIAFRQPARGTAEVELLADWGVAEAAGDRPLAAAKLDAARSIATVVREIGGDTLLEETVQAIDGASPSERRTLAAAHVLYRRARLVQRDRHSAEAEKLFEQVRSLFATTSSPMVALIDYWIANCRSDGSGAGATLPFLRELRRHVPASYKNLQGLIDWQEATVLNRLGLDDQALSSYSRALAIFESLQEQGSASRMRNFIAVVYANLGRSSEAWSVRKDLFREVSASGDADGLKQALWTTAQTELADRHDDIAHALLTIARDIAGQNPRLAFEIDLWTAMTASQLGWSVDLRQELVQAAADLVAITDPRLRVSSENDLRMVKALRTSEPREAIALFSDYMDTAAKLNEPFFVPQMTMERARAYRRLGDAERARNDYVAALTALEARAGSVTAPDFRDRYFASADQGVAELIDLTDSTADGAATLAVQERWRGTTVFRNPAGSSLPADVEALSRSLPRDVTVVEYVALADRLLVFTIAAGDVTLERVPVRRDELRELVAAQVDELRHARPERPATDRLSHLLLDAIRGPVTNEAALVIVPDPLLDDLGFAALTLSGDPHPLIEQATLIFAPSMSSFVARAARPAPPAARPSAAVVGNPSFDHETFELESLPGAEIEARAVAAFYGTQPIIGTEATRARVMGALRSAEIVQIGAHAVADPVNPDDSFLLLAPSKDDAGTLRLRDVSMLPLAAVRLAVVAGCRTSGAGNPARQLRNLALAFLAAGVRNVVASSWDLDDSVGPHVCTELHRRLASGIAPAAALRDVQRSMSTSPSARLASPASWASLRIYGAGR